MLKKYFVNQGIKEVSIEDFIRENFPSADYSKIELQRTPLGIKIVIYTHKPGRVIGRGGSKINKMSDILKERFELDNPQIDVKSIGNPNLDAKIVAKQIKTALERGYNYKKIGNLSMKRVMEAGAIGTEIIISGKLGGSKGRMGKFTAGYLKHCGDTAQKLVDHGFEEANTKPGKIGVKVKIMREFMDITGAIASKKPEPEERAPRPDEDREDISIQEGSLDFDYEETETEEEQATEEPEHGKKAKEEPAREPAGEADDDEDEPAKQLDLEKIKAENKKIREGLSGK